MVEPNAECCLLPAPSGSSAQSSTGGLGSTRWTTSTATRGSAENIAVQDNPGESRYELLVDQHVVGEILYRLTPDHIVLLHTEVLPSLEGKGSGRDSSPARSTTSAPAGCTLFPSVRSCARTFAGIPNTPISLCGTRRFQTDADPGARARPVAHVRRRCDRGPVGAAALHSRA